MSTGIKPEHIGKYRTREKWKDPSITVKMTNLDAEVYGIKLHDMVRENFTTGKVHRYFRDYNVYFNEEAELNLFLLLRPDFERVTDGLSD